MFDRRTAMATAHPRHAADLKTSIRRRRVVPPFRIGGPQRFVVVVEDVTVTPLCTMGYTSVASVSR